MSPNVIHFEFSTLFDVFNCVVYWYAYVLLVLVATQIYGRYLATLNNSELSIAKFLH